MNADGTIGANDDVISHNLFAYCSNNPINSTDLEGQFLKKIIEMAVKTTKVIISKIIKIFPTKQKKIPDYTKELNNTLVSNTAQMHVVGKQFSGANSLSYFYSQVKSGGPWDYKIKENWERDIKAPYLGVSGQFIYNGIVTTAEDFGNIHYGFIGTLIGFSPKSLYIGGGYAKNGITFNIFKKPYYGDDINDHNNIQRGINMYYQWTK